MNDSFSQNLLLAIVHGLRLTCKKKITCENFIVISGFLSFDVDGKAKHRFVINELMNSDNNGEGHSSCLKVIDWNYLRRRISSQRNEKTCQQSNINPVKHNAQGNNFQEGQTKSKCERARSRTRQNAVERCLSGPVSQCPFTKSRNRMSNQTFTLEDCHEVPSAEIVECNLTRNFSSATVSIASRKMLPDHKVPPEMDNEQKCPKLTSSCKILTSTCPSMRLLCKDNMSTISASDILDVSYLNNNLSDKLSKESVCSHGKMNTNIVSTKPKAMSQKNNNICTKGSKCTQKLSRTVSNSFKRQCTKSSSKRNARQVVKLRQISSSVDSDVSIDAIRPRYLVKHNDELLLPCPNLSSKYNKHLATTKNNNRAHYISSKSCEESVQNTSHISTLFSSIIGALSYSSYRNMQDGSSNKCDAPLNVSLDKLKGNDRIHESSNGSLQSVSNLETDSATSSLNKASEQPNGRSTICTKKMSYVGSSDSKENGKSSSVLKQSQNVLNWTNFFR